MQRALNRVVFKVLTAAIILTMYLVRMAGWLNSVRFKMICEYRKLNYQSSPEDIFIVTYPKSGTTWMQMIVYQLITPGEMNIKHIGHMLPNWDLEELDLETGGRYVSSDPSLPRVFKSHYRYRDIPKGSGRYIYVVRDGLDVAVSGYYHARKFGLDETFEAFFEKFITGSLVRDISGGATWFEHVAEWVENKNQLNVLVVRYEDLIADLSGSIRCIAEFCGVEILPGDWSRVLRNCSFEFMRVHEDKLDPLMLYKQEISDEDRHFIRRGKVGGWRNLMDEELLGAFREKGKQWSHIAVLEKYCRQTSPGWRKEEEVGSVSTSSQ